MASTSTTISSALVDAKSPRQSTPVAASPQCVTLPTLPLRITARRVGTAASLPLIIVRDVVARATGETSAEVATTELPDIAKSIQEAWDKLEDKYAVTSLAAAVALALWGSTGLISAIDRLPLVPGVLELVGIGYSGWFAYRNLIFKPDREALIKKIKDTYRDIVGSS